MTRADSKACPCGRALPYAACCGRFVDGGEPAPDAESLMRSRYTAFALGRGAYLLSSWHPSTRPAEALADASVRWLGLEVKARRNLDANHAEVEFVARYRSGPGPAGRLHELSRFVREDGRWYYVEAAGEGAR